MEVKEEQTMNAQDEIKELKQRIAELEEQVEQEQVFPQEGDTFWFLNTYGVVMGRDFKKDSVDSKILKSNIFETQQEAEYALEKLKVEAELQEFSRLFVPGEKNWKISLDTMKNQFEIKWNRAVISQGAFYFEDESEAMKAIHSVGADRIKKYIFGVEG